MFGPIALWAYMINMPGKSHSGPMEPLSADELVTRDNLRTHVIQLAGTFGERNVTHYDSLKASADYIERIFAGHGCNVARQEFMVDGKLVANVEAEFRGTSLPDEIVILGAHYDSYSGSPGGNDNASGVAGMLELARLLKAKRPAHTVRLVGFVNEEPPFFQTPQMGSWVYAKRCRLRGDRVTGMISLDAIGRYSEARHTQKCPLPFNLFYPDTGNFLGFVGNALSRGLVRRTIGTFRKTVKFPSEGISAPGILSGIGWSDHWSFWQEGYRALTITDTSDERYKEYHTKADTAELLDYDRMARVMSGMVGIMTDLAGEPRGVLRGPTSPSRGIFPGVHAGTQE